MPVHWPLCFVRREGGEALEAVTEDLTSEGFHCRVKIPFVPGENRFCTLGVPTHYPKNSGRMLTVKCKVQVIWTKAAADGFYKVGFRIENYEFVDSLPIGASREPGWSPLTGF